MIEDLRVLLGFTLTDIKGMLNWKKDDLTQFYNMKMADFHDTCQDWER